MGKEYFKDNLSDDPLKLNRQFFISVPSVTSVLKTFRISVDWKHPTVHAKLDAVQS